MRDVVPCGGGFSFLYSPAPFLPWQETEPGIPPEPLRNGLRIAAERQRRRGNDVKVLTDGGAPAGKCTLESLGDVIGVHVVNRLQAEVGKDKILAPGKAGKDLWIEMAGGVQRRPPRPNNVSGMQHGGRKTVRAGLLQQIRFDSGFLAAIVAKGTAGLFLRHRDLDAVAMYPNRPAMQEVLHAPAQSFHELPGT